MVDSCKVRTSLKRWCACFLARVGRLGLELFENVSKEVSERSARPAVGLFVAIILVVDDYGLFAMEQSPALSNGRARTGTSEARLTEESFLDVILDLCHTLKLSLR